MMMENMMMLAGPTAVLRWAVQQAVISPRCGFLSPPLEIIDDYDANYNNTHTHGGEANRNQPKITSSA